MISIVKEPIIVNDKVKETLKKLGNYKYDPNIDKKYFNSRKLGPYVLIYSFYESYLTMVAYTVDSG